jgi:hypothetical protein
MKIYLIDNRKLYLGGSIVKYTKKVVEKISS